VVKFYFTKSKLRENHFSTKSLIGKSQISKSRGALGPLCTHIRRPYSILCECWIEDCFPKEMRDVMIMTLYENEGGIENCNDCSGIFFMLPGTSLPGSIE